MLWIEEVNAPHAGLKTRSSRALRDARPAIAGALALEGAVESEDDPPPSRGRPTAAPMSAPAIQTTEASVRADERTRGPSLREPGTRAVLLFVALLAVLSWSAQDGYQLADSVEYLERAVTFVRGEQMIDAGAIRPFGFSSLIFPFVLISDWMGLPASRALFWSANLLQVALALALVLLTMRIAARIAGRPAGFAAGLLLAANPILLQYSVQPVSGIAAGVCVALALERLLERGGFRASLVPGLWLGAAFLMAYQTLLVALVVIALVVLRDRLRAWRSAGALLLGVLAGMGAQSLLDLATYGVFGVSVGNYLVQNFGSVLTTMAYRLGLVELAREIYGLAASLAQEWPEVPVTVDRNATLRALQRPDYYLVELPRLLVWPALALGALGLARALVKPRWATTLLAGTVIASAVVMSLKGAKSFRLWLPLLPALAPIVALGFATLLRGPRPLKWIAAALVVASVPLGLRELGGVDQRRFGAWWRAMEWVNAEARHERERAAPGLAEPLVVGSAYHWAVYLRETPDVRLIKLPWQLHLWDRYDEGQRRQALEALDGLDLLLVHLPVLHEQPELLDEIDRRFSVRAAFYDQRTDTETGPILVFGRLRGRPDELRLWTLTDEPALAGTFAFEGPLAFAGIDPQGRPERLELVGYRYDPLPGGLGWITYEWTTPTGLTRDWTVIDRLTAPDETNAWNGNHALAWGRVPAPELEAGRFLREGHLVVAAEDPYLADAPRRPLGGGYRRGDLIPVRLWMKIVVEDVEALARGELVELARLEPLRPGSERPLRPPGDASRTADGWLFSPDGLVALARFWMPVQAFARAPDDGRPLED